MDVIIFTEEPKRWLRSGGTDPDLTEVRYLLHRDRDLLSRFRMITQPPQSSTPANRGILRSLLVHMWSSSGLTRLGNYNMQLVMAAS